MSQGYTEMGEIAAQQMAESSKPGGLLNKLKETGQQALDAVSTEEQKEWRKKEQEREEQQQKRQKETEEQADAAQQSVLGSLAKSARDTMQGVSNAAGGSADQTVAHKDQPARAL